MIRVRFIIFLFCGVLFVFHANGLAAESSREPSTSTHREADDALDRALAKRVIPDEKKNSSEMHSESEAANSPRGLIEDFLSTWTLFGSTYIVGWLLAATLALAGVFVVARDQIFLGAAISQASTLGIALALLLESVGWAESPLSDSFLSPSVLAVVFAILAARIAQGASEPGRESNEARLGWMFLLAASGSVLLVAKSPHGLEDIQRLLSSSILGATQRDVAIFSGLFLLIAILLALFWRPLLLLTLDPPMATAVGLHANRWAWASSIVLGLVVGLAIRSAGMLYTFGCLVLPALAAKNLCREVRPMLLLSPILAVACGLLGFVLANHYDYPPAQMAVALQAIVLAVAWAHRRRTWGK